MKQARLALGLSQDEFAITLGKSQGTVSKYERAEVEPPWSVISHCMNVLSDQAEKRNVSIDEVVLKVREIMGEPRKATLRRALMSFLESMEG